MELKPVVTSVLFILLGCFYAFFGGERPVPPGNELGVWRGTVETVTAGGAMVRTSSGTFWVSHPALSLTALRGDSLLVLGYRSQGFISPMSIRRKPASGLVRAIRESYRRILLERIDDPAARGLTGGLTLGLRGLVPAGITDVFRETGTSHLLALSGLHTVIVAALAFLLFRLLLGRHPASHFTAAAFTIIFVLLSGGRPSTVRAGIMSAAALFWTALHGGRMHGLSLWWMALLASVLLSPVTLLDRGAQMSFGAVLSLLLLGRSYRGRASMILSPLHAGVAVTVGLSPLIAGVYGGLSPAGPVATVLSLPFMASVMVLGSAVSAGAGLLEPLLGWITGIWTSMLSALSPGVISVGRDPLLLLPWGFSVLLLRVLAKWNGFHRRFR